ncbi:MAG TPA: hypothetical protein V6C65_26195 [Allocoleopsis sp.]
MSKTQSLRKISYLKKKRENFDLLDCDYLNKLSAADAAFLADALEDIYEGRGSGRDSRKNDVMYSDPPATQRKNQPNYTARDWDGQPSSLATPEEILLIQESLTED